MSGRAEGRACCSLGSAGAEPVMLPVRELKLYLVHVAGLNEPVLPELVPQCTEWARSRASQRGRS